MRWFRRKTSDAASLTPARTLTSPISPPALPSPGSQLTPSMTDGSSQISTSPTSPFFPATRPPISDDSATSSNMSSLFRRNTASSSWLARLAGLLSGIPDAKELIGPLTDICGAIGFIFERKRKVTVHKAEWNGVFTTLEGHRRTFGEYHNLFINDDTLLEPDSPILAPLRSYASELENMIACLLAESGSGVRNMRRPSLSPGIRSNIEAFDHLEVTADLVTGYSDRLVDHMQQFLLSAAVFNNVSTPAIQSKLKRHQFEPCISTASRALWAQGLQHSECLADTRVATLNEIDTWARNGLSKVRMFCLVDFEGTGKSTIANHMARKWQSEGRLAVRFFFSQGFTGASSAYDLPLYIAHALRENFPDIEDQLGQAQGDLKRVATLPITDQWDQLVVSSLRLINDKPRVIVIDGLNECSADSRQLLLECILETCRSSQALGNIKFLLTTRNDPKIERLLLGGGTTVRMESLTLTPSQRRATLQDISLYIHHRMSHVQEPSMSDQDYEDLVTRSGGRFIFAATACTILLRSRHRRACLGRIVSADDSNALDALYLSTLRYARELDEACSVDQIKLFLSIVIAIKQPLPLPTITALLSKATPAINLTRIIENLAGIVSGGVQGEPIRIIHSTFREFLLKASVSREYSINLNAAHAILSNSCLLLLLQGLKTDICSLSTPGDLLPLNTDIQKLEMKINNSILPPVQYAALNWPVHALLSIHNPGTLQLVRQLFTKNILNWLELGFLCGQGSAYIVGLRDLQVGIENCLMLKHSSFNDIDNQWCLDILHFIWANETLLDVSVLQLYTSGIAFTPSNSLIARHYAHVFKHALPSIPRGISTAQNGPLVLKGHRNTVNCVAYSLDGTRLVSGSSDGTLILWDAESGAQISQLPGLGVSIGCISYSPRGNFIIYGAEDGYIRKWDCATSDAMELGSLDTLESISSLCWSPNGFEIMGGTSNGSLWGLGMLFPSEVNDYGRVHSDTINCVAYSPTGTTIASASSDHTVKIWHVGTLETSAEPTFILEHASAVHCVAFSPTRPVLATGTDHFHVWKVDTGLEIFRGILEGTLRCLSYSPDGTQVITSHGSDIRQRETNTRSFTGSKFEGHTDDITCVSYSPKGDFIASGSHDRSLRLWNLCHVNLDQDIGHKTTVTSLSFSQDGGSLASAASDGTFCLWNVEKAILKLGPIHTPLGRINAIAYSPNMELVACAGAASYVGLWSTKTGVDTGVKLPRFFDATSVTRISFSPNGCFIAVKAESVQNLLFVWAIQKLTSSAPLKLVLRVNTDGKKYAFHPNSNFVCIGDQAWNLQSHPPKLVSAEDGLLAILSEVNVAEISYRYEHGFDWLYVGSPPRHAFAIPNQFNVMCHAIHSKIAALGGEDGRVVFIDCDRPAAQVGWKLSPGAKALTLDVNTWSLPSSDGVSVGGSSPTLNGNDYRNPNGNKYVPLSGDSQVMTSERAGFDSISTASNVTCDVPDLTGSVRKLQRKPIFNGTYSTVYEGELDGKKVAIKALRAVNSLHAMRRKYRRELETWWRLVHPNVTPLLGSIEDEELGDFGILISPWAEMGNAATYIGMNINYSQRINLFHDVSKGLKYLHEFNPTVVHADLKPANVLIDGDGTARLCDFGLVRIVQTEANTHTGMTTTTAHAGTARYLAYELVESLGDNLPTTASDIHALACIGMEFIYVCPPYAEIRSNQAMAQLRICKAIGSKVPPVVRPDGITGIVVDLWNAFETCWHLEPSCRPTADEICEYLAAHGAELAAGLAECESCVIEPRDLLF